MPRAIASRRTPARNCPKSLPAGAATPPPSGIASSGAAISSDRRLGRKGVIDLPPLTDFPRPTPAIQPDPISTARPAHEFLRIRAAFHRDRLPAPEAAP